MSHTFLWAGNEVEIKSRTSHSSIELEKNLYSFSHIHFHVLFFFLYGVARKNLRTCAVRAQWLFNGYFSTLLFDSNFMSPERNENAKCMISELLRQAVGKAIFLKMLATKIVFILVRQKMLE